jgi:hypothetical protein
VETLLRIIKDEDYTEEFYHSSMKNMSVKEDEFLEMTRL